MRDIIYRPGALADLDTIADYTKALWGDTQAAHYLHQIRAKVEALVAFPAIGSQVFGLPTAYRKIAAGHHRIIYRHTDSEVIVVRIIHEREDMSEGFDDVG
jgi:toxin ParE1/3/4